MLYLVNAQLKRVTAKIGLPVERVKGATYSWHNVNTAADPRGQEKGVLFL